VKSEIDQRTALEAWLRSEPRSGEVVLQGLDLAPYENELLASDLHGCVFVGCRMSDALAAHAAAAQCLIIPPFPDKPFDAFRAALYTPEELFAGFDPADPSTYTNTLDARVYSYFKQRTHSLDDVLARRIHDFSIADALEDLLKRLDDPRIVAVMGGHSVVRGATAYREIARLTRTLARDGMLIMSGGGPGIMEAANLGSYFAEYDDGALEEALRELATAPEFTDGQWLASAYRVKLRYPPKSSPYPSIGIPTWFYGHELPNAFATHIAKYFENSVREEGLLAVATHGVIFAQGNAGTVQEIFQDACQNYYRTYSVASPMILYGSDYWNPPDDRLAGDRRKNVFPLLMQLASEAKFEHLVRISDSVEEIVDFIRHPPTG
jgi:predicted Rossmann-fold nucleotide-binding protein